MKPIDIPISDDRKFAVSIVEKRIHIRSYYRVDLDSIEPEFYWSDDIFNQADIDIDVWAAFVEAVNKMDKLMVLK